LKFGYAGDNLFADFSHQSEMKKGLAGQHDFFTFKCRNVKIHGKDTAILGEK